MKTKRIIKLFHVLIMIIILFHGSSTVSASTSYYQWERVNQASFSTLGIESIGPLVCNGSHLLTFDSTTMQLLVIDLELTAVLANYSVVHVVDPSDPWSKSYPLIYGLTLAKGYLFAASIPQRSIYLLDPVNYTVLEARETVLDINDLTYDEETDCFAVTLVSDQLIALYNGSYFNGSLSSMEFGSLDAVSLIDAWDYPEPMPASIASCDGEYFVVTLTGSYTHFSVTSEGLEFIHGKWNQMPVETYTGYTQDACFINYTCAYFTSPLSHKIVLFSGVEVEDTTTSVESTESTVVTGNSTGTTTTDSVTGTDPFVSSTGGFDGMTTTLSVITALILLPFSRGKNRGDKK